MPKQKRVALRVVIVLAAAGVVPLRAIGQLSAVSNNATGSTCSVANTTSGFCGNAVSFPVPSDGTTFTSKKAWNVNADVGAFSTLDISSTSVHAVTFTATSPGSYRVTIDTSRFGDVNRVNDAAGCLGQASVGGVSASTNIALTTGDLTLADPSDLASGGTTSSLPFSQTSSATIDRVSNGIPQMHSLSFSWSGSVRSNSCEAAVRIGLQNGSTVGCSACEYPGSPSRTESTDGHFVVVTITHFCGDGIANGLGEECDQGGLNGTAGSCCDINCTLKSHGTACTDDGNVCTDDQCDGVSPTCQHPHNTAPCTDDVFCNGGDTCSGGSCSVHDGDPCPGPDGDSDCSETCDEDADDCLGNDPDGTLCRPAAGECDTEEQCAGGSCPADSFAAIGTACGDPSDTDCTNPDTCDGTGSCDVNDEAAGTPCGDPSDTDCTNPDTCDGAGSCDVNDETGGTPCGDPSDTDCDNPDTCDGSGTCLVNNEADGTTCDDSSPCTSGDECAGGVCQGPIDVCPDLDHYKCYQGKDLKNPRFTQQMVQTDDQLVNDADVEVKKLAFVCSPVDTNGEGINNANAHLACYQVKEPTFAVRPKVEVSTQFQTSQFEVKKGALLCLPATKTLLP